MSTMRWLAAALKPTRPPAAFRVARRAAARRRERRRADFRRCDALRGQRRGDPVHQIIGIGRIVDMLELAAAAHGEMAAGRILMVRPGRQAAVAANPIARARSSGRSDRSAVTPSPRAARRTTVSTGIRRVRREAREQIVGDQEGPGAAPPRGRAARPRRRRPQRPRARTHAAPRSIPASTSPLPALASQAGAGGAIAARPSGAATTVSGALVDDDRAARVPRRRGRARPCRPRPGRTASGTRPRAG